MPSVFIMALGKELVRRVPEGIHSANIKILGKFEDSGSVPSVIYVRLISRCWARLCEQRFDHILFLSDLPPSPHTLTLAPHFTYHTPAAHHPVSLSL